jgi:hypothetical protein
VYFGGLMSWKEIAWRSGHRWKQNTKWYGTSETYIVIMWTLLELRRSTIADFCVSGSEHGGPAGDAIV